MNYSDKLRALAAWLDDRPEILTRAGEWTSPSVSIYLHTDNDINENEKFSTIVREMGTCEKSGHHGQISANHVHRDSENNRIFAIFATLSGACEKTVKTDEDGNPVRKPVQKWVDTGETEVEYEWKCPESFLNL